jgi:hypothetical protein
MKDPYGNEDSLRELGIGTWAEKANGRPPKAPEEGISNEGILTEARRRISQT